MPLSIPIAFLLSVVLESLLLGALALWWGCRFLKISPISGRRALGVNFASVTLAALFQLALSLLIRGAGAVDHLGPIAVLLLQLGIAAGGLLAMAAAQTVLLAKLLATQMLRALLAWVVMNSPVLLINFCLAVLARAVVVEPFVVPTGSMAPTILGVHADRTCDHCGFSFTASLSSRLPRHRWEEDRTDEQQFPTLITACPNCRQPDRIGGEVAQQGGDRIMVDKQVMPTRWEISVHRYPEDRRIKFVQRLVGLPGETLEIVAGDVFADGKRLQKPPVVAQDLWLHVHDTAFRGQTPGADEPGWRASEGSSWREEQGFWTAGDAEAEEAETDALDYFGPITDFNAYNAEEASFAIERDEYLVGDVLTVCDVASLSDSGKFGMRWSFRGDKVEAWLGGDGAVEISADSRSGGESARDRLSGKLKAPLTAGDRIAFAVRDGQAYVVHNDQLVLLLPFGPQDVAQAKRASQAPAEPCRLSLVADRSRVSLSRIVLARDVYYRGGDVDDEDWLVLKGSRDNPVTLGETEYFALGDNSSASKDSRFYGDLQKSDLIGTARWIYWPKSRWRAFR